MGQESSREQIDPNTPPHTLSARTLDGVAEFIQDGRPKRIVVMTGAGISTSAGIPDFRSPDTGLYANLARLNLPYAEAVFDIQYFRQNPDPFYVLAKELYPGKFYPTVAHSFIALLHEKGLLQMLFTQNIDCLERRAGVPGDKIVEAHGSFATQRCIECKTEYPDDQMKEAVESGDVPHCIVPQCNGLVKPDIVFFGEQLPEAFHQNTHVPAMADLVIVMGTSLSVHPFASLPQLARQGTPRVLINKERVGDFGSRLDDVVVLEDCDAGVRKLADVLGWRDELEAMWHEVSGKLIESEAAQLDEKIKTMTKDELLEAEIEKLTSEIDASLKLSKDHTDFVNKQLGTSPSKGEPSLDQKEPCSVGEKVPGVVLASDSNPSSGAATRSEGGWKEPPSTPANKENKPLTTERGVVEKAAGVVLASDSNPSSGAATRSEGGWKEPPSTPANKENKPLTTERGVVEKAASVVLASDSNPSSGVATRSEGGWKEPPSTPANKENTPLTTEKVVVESKAAAPSVDRESLVDLTLPHNRPTSDDKEPESKI